MKWERTLLQIKSNIDPETQKKFIGTNLGFLLHHFLRGKRYSDFDLYVL